MWALIDIYLLLRELGRGRFSALWRLLELLVTGGLT